MSVKHGSFGDIDIAQPDCLLSHVLARADQEKATQCSRFVLTSRVPSHASNETAIKGAFNRVVQKHWTRDAGVTGLLLLYPSCLACLLEGSSHTLMQLLHDLHSAPELAGVLLESRVLLSSEGLPQRCCSGWHAAFVPSSSGLQSSDPVEPDKLAKAAANCCANLRQLAQDLTSLSEGELRRHLQSLATYHPDVPNPESLLALANSQQLPSLQQWVDLFTRPVSAVLAADLTWPLPKPLFV